MNSKKVCLENTKPFRDTVYLKKVNFLPERGNVTKKNGKQLQPHRASSPWGVCVCGGKSMVNLN